MAALLSTGVPGLDELLAGGVRTGSALLVEGVPGAGKTTLGLQFLQAGLEHGQHGLIITFEEFPQQLYQDALSLGWDLRGQEEAGQLRVVCTSPQVFLDQLSEVGGLVDAVVAEIGAQRLLLDSVSHLNQVTSEPTPLRALVYSMLNGLKRANLSALVTKELDSALRDQVPFEEYLADIVVRLTYEIGTDMRRRRYVEVVKARGTDHAGGKHAMRITRRGLVVYPRPTPGREPRAARPTGSPFVPSGVPGLDEMLCGGFPRAGSTLAAGSAGVGKTTLGLQFLIAGAEHGEPGLLVCFEESPERLQGLAASTEIPLQHHVSRGTLRIMHRSPVDLLPEELLYEIKRRLTEECVQRLVVDSLTDLEMCLGGHLDLRELVYDLVDMAREAGVTSVFTTEVPELFGQTYVTTQHLSVMVDGIVLLKYLEMESEIQRAISILKMRGCRHDQTIRRYEIGEGGMRVLARFEGTEGLMVGQARRAPVQLATRSFTELDERLNQELLQRFSMLHPNVEAVDLHLPQNPDDGLVAVNQALSMRPSSLSAVPICQYWLPELLGTDRLRPLDDLLPPDRRVEHLEGLVRPALRDDHLYAIPALALAGIFYYRQDLLEKHGFSAPPATWDELVRQTESIVAAEEEPLYGFEFPAAAYEGLSSTFLSLLWSNGGEVVDAQGRYNLSGAPVREVLEFLHEVLCVRRITPPEMTTIAKGVDPETDFVEGRAVFLFMLPNALQKLQQASCPVRERVGIGLLPVGPSGREARTFLGGWHYGIARDAAAPQAAAEFIRFMTSQEVQKERALRGGPLPTLRALYEDPEILAFNPFYRALRPVLAAGRIREDYPDYPRFSKALQRVLHPLVRGEVGVEETWAGLREAAGSFPP
jgi:circadian clock protein KaiC